MVLIVRCLNGAVIWRSVALKNGSYALLCVRDKFQIAISRTADATWETALSTAVTHSVGLAGAFQQLYVLPDRV